MKKMQSVKKNLANMKDKWPKSKTCSNSKNKN